MASPSDDPDEIYRSEAKSGTSHFHAYATLYVIRNGYRFTVALTAVTRGEPLEAVLKRLLRQAATVGVRCRLLLLDRGFYSVGVIRYLQAARHPFLMPVICRGRKLDDPRGPSGTNVFLTWEKSGWGPTPCTTPTSGRPGSRSVSSAATTAANGGGMASST